jgi:hypothetical protein
MSRRLWIILIAVVGVAALVLVPDAVSARTKPPKHHHNVPASAPGTVNPNLTIGGIPGIGTITLPGLPGLTITLPPFTPGPTGTSGGGGAGGTPGGTPGPGPSGACPGGGGGAGGSPGGGAGGCGG